VVIDANSTKHREQPYLVQLFIHKKPSCVAVGLAFCPNQMPTAPGDPAHGAASGNKDTPKGTPTVNFVDYTQTETNIENAHMLLSSSFTTSRPAPYAATKGPQRQA
jgi:hypothetical protein